MNKNFSIFSLIMILILMNSFNSSMTNLPDTYNTYDPPFLDDIANVDELNKYIMFSYVMRASGTYVDKRTGIIYSAAQNCYAAESMQTVPLTPVIANYITGVIANYPSLVLTNTLMPLLYDKIMESNPGEGLFFPLSFHSDRITNMYYLTFKLVNINNVDVSFSIKVQGTADTTIFHTLNTISQTILANSIKDYTIKFSIATTGFLTYYLEEESFANSYTPPVGFNIKYFENAQATSSILTSWNGVTSPNMRLYINNSSGSPGTISVAAIILKSENKSGTTWSTTTGSTSAANDCLDSRVCVNGRGCYSNRCNTCYRHCKFCKTNANNMCTQCYPNSTNYDQINSVGMSCPLDHMDFSKIDVDISINVPPSVNFRVTVDFWMWVYDVSKFTKASSAVPLINVIYKDFLTISIIQDSSNNQNLVLYCTPIEYLYQLTSANTSTALKTLLTTTLKPFHMKETFTSASSKWKHIQCAFNFDSAKTYFNELAETTLSVPKQYQNINSFPWFQKKFYDVTATTTFNITGHSAIQTNIYFKNFNIYREYIPQNLSYLKYFYVYKIASQAEFPQLLYSIPFDDFTNGATNTFKSYDYSLRTTNSIVTNSHTTTVTATSLEPPRNFRRLNLLDLNKYFNNFDLTLIANMNCPSGSNMRYCWDDSKAFTCLTNYYLNPLNWSCSQSCPNGFMRYPNDINNDNNGYCLNPCDSNILLCPSTTSTYQDISNFSCSSNFINAYYKCYSDSSNFVDTALQFSSTLNTQPFEIDLGTSYNAFVIDVWIYADMRFNNPQVDDYIFLTNNHSVSFGTITSKLKASGTSFNFQTGDTFNLSTWNHLVIYADYTTTTSTSTKFYMSFKNIILRPNSNTSPTSNTLSSASSLSKIYFCNKDSSMNAACTGTWINAFYKNLRIWDATYTNNRAVVYYTHYSDINSTEIYNLKHFFPMDLSNLIQNKIQDKLNPTIYGIFPIDSAATSVNPDKTNQFNYVVNYAYEDMYPGNIISTFTVAATKEVSITATSTCNAACSKCYGTTSSTCFECSAGYGLWSNQCTQNSSTPQYYYRNPPSNPTASLSLNISPLNLPTYPGLTIFFFLKLYGFTDSQSLYKIIIFDSANNYYLAYNPTVYDGSLELYFGNVLQFQYKQFRSNKFGSWVPISIAAYRQTNASLFPNMISMTIDVMQMPILDTLMNSYTVTEFTMPKTWIGLISDITFYKSFILNVWGFFKFGSDYNNNSKYILGSFPMKSNMANQCLGDYQILTVTTAGIGLKCVSDYNPLMKTDACASNIQNLYFNEDETGQCATCYCVSGSTTSTTGGRCIAYQSTCACDHKDPSWVYNFISTPNDSRTYGPANTTVFLECNRQWTLDFSRFNYGVIPNISNPNTTFNMEFWFYTQSYVGVNFSALTITWNKHIKISMTYNGSNFIAYCTPIPDVSNPGNDSTPNSITYATSRNRTWVYLNCGVDATIQKFYFINNVTVPAGTSYTTTNTIPTSGLVNLTIKDDSPNGYGVTYLRQVRVWNCYSCSTAYRNIVYISGNINFENVLHIYSATNNTGYLLDEQGTSHLQMVERSNFIGYNLLYWDYNPPQCSESGRWFYNSVVNYCNYMNNMNRVRNVTYPSLPASRTSRYTIEVWMWIEDVSQFTYGMNFIYDRHVGLSVLRDNTTTTSLVSICFPQEYKDDLDNKSGTSVYSLHDSALNKAKDSTANASSSWQFFRCAVDLTTRQIFYLNQTGNQSITPETIYGTTTNYRGYRFFDMPQYVNIYIQNHQLNNTRIFLKYLSIYREFMDISLYDLRYRDMKVFVASVNFWPIVFTTDFEYYDGNYRFGYYYYNDPDNNTFGSQRLTDFDNLISSPVYTTYPNYTLLKLCGSTQYGDGVNTCTNIGTTGCNATTDFCLAPAQYFYFKNKYVNMSDLTVATSCTNGTSRLPDSNSTDGYCLFTCPNVNNIQTCGSTAANILEANYSTQFTCATGYTRVYYNCILDSLVPFSSLYFNQFYSWTNLIKDFTPTYKESYFFEFWFLMDNVNGPGDVTAKNLYLLAPPHYIFKDPDDQLFKYANYEISAGTLYYKLASISRYEWNRIIIHTQKNTSNNSFNIYIYVNYNFINPDVTITNMSANLYDFSLQGVAFCNKPQATCQINGITYNPTWGTAWYKNIRVWDDSITSPYMIQSFGNSFNEYLKALYYFYPMTIDTIDEEQVKEKIDETNNSMNARFWFFNKNYDNDIRLNYSINYDYGQINPETYITGVNTTNKTYLFSGCNSACKRCYTGSQFNCYECNPGYALNGNTCYSVSAYFFKTPTNDSTVTTVRIQTTYASTVNFDISNQNPLTITFFLKYMGTQQSVTTANYYPIVYFNSSTTFLAFDSVNKEFVLYINSVIAYKVPNAQTYIGVWTHIGLSIYRSSLTTLLTHMFNFMFHKSVIAPQASFNPTTTPVNFDRIEFDTKTVALYSTLKFFSNFYVGTFGHITASSSSQSKDFILEIRLNGSTNTNCLTDADLISPQTTSSIDMTCIGDYNPYLDSTILCSDDKKYFDLTLTQNSLPCGDCDSTCNTNCYKSGSSGCTCTFNSMKNWIATQTPVTSYYCHPISSINYALYNSITIPNISTVKNEEMSIEFWTYNYSFVAGNFASLNISWDKHIRVELKTSGAGSLQANCYPYVDMSNFGDYTNAFQVSVSSNSWQYVRCAVNRFYKTFYMNKLGEASYTQAIPVYTMPSLTTLTISDNSPLNYGISFIRELKLLSSYSFSFWDASQTNLKPMNYPYLLHFFKNDYDGTDALMKDIVANTNNYPIQKSGLIGYNYVTNFKDLFTCDEGYYWDYSSVSCKPFATTLCKVSADNNNNCLACPDEMRYLHPNNTCTSDCGVGYYPDDYLRQCRDCDESCYTCNGKKPNQCTSCNADSYYIPGSSICDYDCEKYGLTKSLSRPNYCAPFTAQAEITNYNILTPINPKIIYQLSARVFNATANNYTVNWRFSDTDTEAINFDKKPKLVLNPAGPFYEKTNQESIFVKTDFFKESYKYVFWFDINNFSPFGYSALVSVQFILIMNDYPKPGYMTSIPSKGYTNTTSFIFSCKNFTDDNTAKNNLKYMFSYFDEKAKELTISDWSYSDEASYKFPLPVNQPSFKYTVKCYGQDIMGVSNFIETSVTIYASPTEYQTTIPIQEMLLNNDFNTTLTEDQLLKRSELLYSLTSDYYKDFILNRTLINNTIQSYNITLNDPVCNQKFCNNRGECYLIDKYLTCQCFNWYGSNCQIDLTSFDFLKSAFQLIYTKLYQSLSIDSSGIVLPGLTNLIKGASNFIDDTSYLLKILDYIELAKTMYPSTFLNNFKEYFEYYNNLIEWGIIRINQYKIQTQVQQFGVINQTTIRNSTMTMPQQTQMINYFNTIKSSFDDILIFYANNLKTSTDSVIYRTKNFNVYITRIKNFFDYNLLFKKDIENQESYIDPSNCIDYIMRTKYFKTTYNIVMTYVNWKTSPFLANSNLYLNNSSPMSGLKFYEDSVGEEIPIEGCVNDTIKMFFPVTNQWLIDFINDKRDIMDPLKQFTVSSTMFNDPMYINAEGKVLNFTVDERVNKYFVPFNFTCDFFNVENTTFDSSACVYKNFTEANYYQCECSHLTDFIVNYFPIEKKFVMNSRFFYLQYYILLAYSGNYFNNIAFFTLAGILGLYISVVIFYSFCDCYIYRKLDIMEYLKKQIIKINMPYRKHYNFNLDMFLPADDFNRIRQGAKRAQNNREELKKVKDKYELTDNDLKLKDVDVLVLGENIGDAPVIERFRRPNLLDDERIKNKAFYKLTDERKFEVDETNKYFDDQLDGDIRPRKIQDNKENEEFPHFSYDSKDVLNLKDLEAKNTFLNHEAEMGDKLERQMNNFMNEDFDKEPEIVVRKRQDDIEEFDDELLDDLPSLNRNYDIEVRLIEFAAIDLTLCQFFRRNLWNRHIVLISLFRISIVYGSFKRIGILTNTLCIMMICISIFLTLDETILFSDMFSDYMILIKFIGFSGASALVSSILLHPISSLLYIDMTIFRSLYWVIVADPGLRILKEWEKLNKNTFCRNFFGILIHFLIYVVAFYFSFCFCATYSIQATTWMYSLIAAIVLDFILFEVFWELIIAMFYSCRRSSRTMLRTAEYLNRIRTMKTLT